MMKQRIERVDNIPLIVHWLKKMKIHEFIDSVFTPHGNWKGLSFGQLTIIFITYILHSLDHRLSGVEPWVNEHKTVLETSAGWKINDKDTTDDRIGILVETLGEDDKKIREFQKKLGRNTIQACQIPTKISRYDTTALMCIINPAIRKRGF